LAWRESGSPKKFFSTVFFIFSLIFWPLSVTREPPLKAKALGSPELLFKKARKASQTAELRKKELFLTYIKMWE